MKYFWFMSYFSVKLPLYLVYMLQQVEYSPSKFLEWLKRMILSKRSVALLRRRGTLHYTSKSIALIISLYCFMALYLAILWYSWINIGNIAVIGVLVMPVSSIFILVLQTWVADTLFVQPSLRRAVNVARTSYSDSHATKIAIIGSYGKTSMKEMLTKVLGSQFKVAATKGNMNVISSQVKFVNGISRDEDFLVIEFGEGAPGDVKKMLDMVQPTDVVITGLAPNHLELYKSIDAIADDFLQSYQYVSAERVYLSGESNLLREFMPPSAITYSQQSVLGWTIKNIMISLDGVSFTMQKKDETLAIESSLLGRHQVAPLSFVSAFAYQHGVKPAAIQRAIKELTGYEHRMSLRSLQGANLIDDTYNGNIEGMRAGLELLRELQAKRKWYVTPGLVDQGEETERVHNQLGKYIADANPDVVVLMRNSVQEIIAQSLKRNGYNGELRVENDPLHFYQNIEHLIAAGDLVVMQNDWTDNYN